MKIIITGATGMVGEGVLLECLQNPAVTEVLMVNRRPFELEHPKLKELIIPNFMKPNKHSDELTGYDACFYCAGISSIGLNEDKYTHITYDITLAFARKMAELNPGMVFTFVTGSHTDSSEKGKVMWARVKGKTENDLMKLPFKKEYNFRPGLMKPFRGQKNVRNIYKPVISFFAMLFPKKTLTLQQVGQAMINAVQKGYSKQVLEIDDIRELSNMK